MNKLNLYIHNKNSYEKIKEAYNNNQNIIAIVHATGTGKSYNALQLAFDNKYKKIIYVVPSNGIIEHIKEIIEENHNLDFEKDFSHIEFRTYQSFINMSKEELKELDVDMLILDELHHLGAPVWGARIEDIIKTHPNIKVFGMTAYTVRDRGTIYERDMANPETNELFSKKIVSRYDICDAMLDGVLPKPIYKSAYINLESTTNTLEEKLEKMNHNSKEYIECKKILEDIKKRIHEAPSMTDVVKKNIKPTGKYIYFCPPVTENGVNNIDTIMNEAKKWFLEMGLSEDNIVFYKTTSDMGTYGKINRETFYNDLDLDANVADGKLRIMFAINQYNEGVHTPNLDGVIMGRGTSSDIVYFEQLGRALSVKGKTKKKYEELEKYSIEELLSMCKKRDIHIKENTPKEEIIEKLIAPIIIDLTNNYEFIKQLETNLQDRVKEIQSKGKGEKRIIKIKDYSFDIEMVNQELYETLRYVMDRLTLTWEARYELAKVFYEKNQHLNIPSEFKTVNGYEYDENGINIGHWIRNQKKAFHKGTLSQDKIKLLELINMNFTEPDHDKWNKMYNLATKYFEHHKDLKIPSRFKTINGYERDENGVDLGRWIRLQMRNYKVGILSQERIKLLNNIKINFHSNYFEKEWNKMYNLAKKYYEYHKNLEIPASFKTINGYERDENGVNLGLWIVNHRKRTKKLSEEKIKLLKEIDMRFETIDYEEDWNKKYKLARIYYEHHKNLFIPIYFKTINGYEEDINGISLGRWLLSQKSKFDKLPKEKQKMLLSIGFIKNIKNNTEKIELLCKENNINIKLNKDIISKISFQEFISKINFLKENNINLTNTQGNLHEIFSMASTNMKVIFGFTLEEMIDTYYLKYSKEKGV